MPSPPMQPNGKKPLPADVAVLVKRLPHFEGLELPAYATDGAAGMDVLAAEDVTLAPGARHAVATGLAVAIPHGFEIQVRPRSGLALKFGITVPNTPGHDRFRLSWRTEGHPDQPRARSVRGAAR